jgi:hypothetical protein
MRRLVTIHCHLLFLLNDSLGRLTPQRPWLRPKVTNSNSLELSDLTVHGVYFEPTVGILSSRIKG